jgi:hypothetical protein
VTYYVEQRIAGFCRFRPISGLSRTCGKPATHELKTSGTASYGFYCEKHAKEEAQRRNHEEGGVQ